MRTMPRYVANSAKALEVIVWLAREQTQIDVYHLVKAVFFADKAHLASYGRPICGDTYDAAPYGPLAQIVYGILRQDHIEMLALGGNGDLPFAVGPRHEVTAYRAPNLRKLSRSEISALESGLSHVRDKSFDDLYNETHDDPAYLNARGGRMDFRDFLDKNDPDFNRKIEDIEDTAGIMVC